MMNSHVRNRLAAVSLTVILCSVVTVHRMDAQQHVRWIGDRALAPFHQVHATTAAVDSVRLLGLMVEFKEDNDPQTQGTGRFDSTVYAGRAIDPPPHDRAFFESKILFVQNYFRKVSNGRLNVDGDVLPSVVTVSGSISDYSRPQDPKFNGLATLAIEAWSIADSAFPGMNFAAYDGYVLFHAGAGKDIDLVGLFGYDPYPFDLPSIYLGLESFRQALDSSAFNGIVVSGGSHLITNTMILPETESRVAGSGETADSLMISINGLFAASVGSHLGLPDLFETGSGVSAIGQFGLMDGASIFAYYGLFPPEPSAWEKVFLGWVDPIVIDRTSSSLLAPAVGLTAVTDTIYKIPITSGEYFLVENRHRDPDGNGQQITITRNGVSRLLRIPRDSIRYFAFDNVDAVDGSVTDVEDFDWALIGFMTDEEAYDGGGILVWHIDEGVINANLATNTVNGDPARRGVDLEEADGAQDIGQVFDDLSGGTGAESGSPLDCWFDGNLAVIYRNVFDANSFPNSHANNGARSLVTIRNFSARSPRMTFDVEIGASDIRPVPGFPKLVAGLPSAVIPFDMDGDGVSEIFTSLTTYSGGGSTGIPVGPARVLGFTAAGVSVLDATDSTGIIGEIAEPAISTPVLFSYAGVSYLAAASTDSVHVWTLTDLNGDSRLDPVLVHAVPGASGPWQLAAVDSFMVAYGDDGISAFTLAGQQIFSDAEPQFVAATGEPGIIARARGMSLRTNALDGRFSDMQTGMDAPIRAMVSGFASPGTFMLAVLTEAGAGSFRIRFFAPAGTELRESGGFDPSRFLRPGESYKASLALADANGDGVSDILLTSSAGRLFMFSQNGVLLEGFPIPAMASGRQEPLIVRSPDGATSDLFVFDSSGTLTTVDRGVTSSTKLADPGSASIALGRLNDAGSPVLALFSSHVAGWIGAWRFNRSAALSDLLWPMTGGDASGSFFSPSTTANPSAIASGLLPADRTYNWPNPVYDDVTYIRYFSEASGTVTVDIFDLAGDKITQLTGSAIAGQDGEIPWNVSGIQSGVYIARIEVNASGQSASRIIKVAVIR